jgi:hypothetical protein
MDDIWLHSDDEKSLQSCVSEVENVLAQLRLSLNSEKTVLFQSKDAGAVVQLVEVSGSAGGIDASLTPEQLLEDAEDAPPFKIGLAVSKMLTSGDFSSLSRFSSGGLSQFTHVADRLAKAFRVSGVWKRFADIYIEFARRHISSESLSVAAWAEMFPNNPNGELVKVHDFFSQLVDGKLQRLLIPLAAQRLVAWSSQLGPGRLTDVAALKTAQNQDDIFRLRGIGYAALKAGMSKDSVGAAIAEAGDEVIEGFLKEKNFEAPLLSERFQSE